MPFEFKDFTDDELFSMREQIEKEMRKRADEEKRQVIDEACAVLTKLDNILQRTITVEVEDPYSDPCDSIDVDIDILNFINALKCYRP